jgi:UDP-N-acetylglucosamine:LPS N-acetylglucosamine transferase
MVPQAALTPEHLADVIGGLLTDRQARTTLAQAALAAGKLDAAVVVARAALNRFASGTP